MQTFLPYADFYASAACLDRQRLGKQRVEIVQILSANLGLTKGWANHPATKMWKGYETGLLFYGLAICQEWKKRGYQDGCEEKMRELFFRSGRKILWPAADLLPRWFGDDAFHRSHQSNLLRKLPTHYSQFGWEVEPNLPYVWPVK